MKHRVSAKGKNMYVILGLVALLLGSLVYLGLQKDTREGMEDEEEMEGMENMEDEEEGMEDMMAGMMNMEGMKGGMDMGKIEGMMKQLEKKEGMAKKEGMITEPYKGRR
jgi:hypothetical protein